MLPARTYSLSIDRDWRSLYELIWRPEFFPKWASGLSIAGLHQDGDGWLTDGPEGPIRISFTPHNTYGVMDHVVETADGNEVHVPMRVVRNGAGAEVMITLFRQPGMSDERYAADAKWIQRDLAALKKLIEAER